MAAFGDSFGVVSSLFSALAMGGVILSLYLQRKDFVLAHAEMRASAAAQGKAATAQVALALAEEKSQTALKDLLSQQTSALKSLQLETALTRLRAKFDDRLKLWKEVRGKCGGAEMDSAAHFANHLRFDADARSYSCLPVALPPAAAGKPPLAPKPQSLPYLLMGADYMAQFKHLIAITRDPAFSALPDDERDDIHLKLRSTLCLEEKIALIHLFPDRTAPAPDPTESSDDWQSDSFLRGLALLDALKGLSKHSQPFEPHWASYRQLVRALAAEPTLADDARSREDDAAASVAMGPAAR